MVFYIYSPQRLPLPLWFWKYGSPNLKPLFKLTKIICDFGKLMFP